MEEQWKAVPGYEMLYEVSNAGRIRSLNYRGSGTIKIMAPSVNRKNGYYMIKLYKNSSYRTRMLHRLVAAAFLGQRPAGMEIRHIDDNKLNNRVSNLTYGTRRENSLDAVKNRKHHQSRKTHCIRGHEFTPENTYAPPSRPGTRSCRKCMSMYGKPEWRNRTTP